MECNVMHPWLSTQLLGGHLDDACTSSHLVERKRFPYRSIGSRGVRVCDCRLECVCGSRRVMRQNPSPLLRSLTPDDGQDLGDASGLLLRSTLWALLSVVSHSRSTLSMDDLHTNHPFPHVVGDGFCVTSSRVAHVCALAQGGRAIHAMASHALYGHCALGRLAW